MFTKENLMKILFQEASPISDMAGILRSYLTRKYNLTQRLVQV